ncbi:hypothetical protein Tco_0276915 [Tanacetum coccineum]
MNINQEELESPFGPTYEEEQEVIDKEQEIVTQIVNDLCDTQHSSHAQVDESENTHNEHAEPVQTKRTRTQPRHLKDFVVQLPSSVDPTKSRLLDVAFHAINARRLPLALLVYTLMTTSSANNSVFKGFFEKQKLTGPNFIDWYRQLRIVLSIEDKLNYLEQPLPPAPVAPAGQHVAPEILAAHTAWVKGSKKIAGLMLMTMEPEIQRNLENVHANDILLF